MKKILVLISFLGLSFSIYGQCHNNYIDISPDKIHIYFSSNRAGSTYDIYRSKLDGSELTRLTNVSIDCFYPSVSPNNAKVVYQRGSYGSSAELWMMDKDGKNEKQLTMNSKHDGYPYFAPNGTHIVYEAWDANGNYPEIFVMDTSGQVLMQLTNQSGAFWNSAPTMNPTGTKIYFAKGLNADTRIASMNTDGSGEIDITTPNSFGYADFGVAFSPQGDKLIFSTTEWRGYNDGSDVVISEPDGSNWQRISMSIAGEYYYLPLFGLDTNDLFYAHAEKLTDGFHIQRFDRKTKTSIQITNCWKVSVNELDQEAVAYPQPCTNRFDVRLRMDIRNASFIIIDALGKKVQESLEYSDAGLFSIDVSNLENGIYFFSVLHEGSLVAKGKTIVAR